MVIPTHQHVGDEPGVAQDCVAVDEHVCLSPFEHKGHLGGFLVGFDEGGEYRGMGAVNVCADATPRWEMSGSLEDGDLTLSPSIRISAPGRGEQLHGFVRSGKWVPA